MENECGEKLPTLLLIGSGSFLARHFIVNSTFCKGVKLVTVGRKNLPNSGRHFELDVGVSSSLSEAIREVNPSHILNCAGCNQGGFTKMVRYNVGVTATIFDTLKDLQTDLTTRVVLIGSAAEYGIPKYEPIDENHPLNPVGIYGLTKKWQTELAMTQHSEGARVTVARIFNLLGPGLPDHLVFGSFTQQIRAMGGQGILEVGNLEPARDFLHVEDAVRALDLILEGKTLKPVYQMASGRNVTIRKLLDLLIKTSGKSIDIRVDPQRLRDGDIASITGSVESLRRDAGWELRKTAEEAVMEMLVGT